MTASMISVDAQTTDFVPTNDYINVRVDAAVKVRIATDDPTLFRAATRNFLYKTTSEISEEVRDTLEGHLRAIIGQMRLTDIITDRAAFSERVQENAKQDLEEMGLEIVAFNIQNVTDQNGVIDNLGIDNTEQIRKTAAIAKANAQKEVAQATAVAQKEANDAQVASQLEIAQKQTDLAKRQAALKVEADTEKAKADAAYEIQSQIQRRDIERETAQADIVKQEQQAVIKEKEVVVTKQALQAEVNAKADADRYAAEKKADAALYARQRQAEAEAFEHTKKADADKQAMLAEAQGIEARGRAEASAIGAKLTAEAEGLEKKAEAMTKMNQAAVLEMYFRALPEVARAVAEPCPRSTRSPCTARATTPRWSATLRSRSARSTRAWAILWAWTCSRCSRPSWAPRLSPRRSPTRLRRACAMPPLRILRRSERGSCATLAVATTACE